LIADAGSVWDGRLVYSLNLRGPQNFCLESRRSNPRLDEGKPETRGKIKSFIILSALSRLFLFASRLIRIPLRRQAALNGRLTALKMGLCSKSADGKKPLFWVVPRIAGGIVH
jgi:hypothetical protein